MSNSVQPIEERRRMGMAERLKLDQVPGWVHGIGLGGTAIVFGFFLLVFVGFKDVPVWADWVPADEFLSPEYGERIYPDSIFRTRMNTWSNLVYICFGFYAIALAIYDWKRNLPLERGYLPTTPAIGFLFGIAGIYLGLGSGFFHASLTRYGQQCDVGGMYAMMICMAAIAIGSWLPRIQVPRNPKIYPSWPLIAILVVYSSVYFSYYKWDYSFSAISNYLTGTLFLFAGVSLIQPGKYLHPMVYRWRGFHSPGFQGSGSRYCRSPHRTGFYFSGPCCLACVILSALRVFVFVFPVGGAGRKRLYLSKSKASSDDEGENP